jgi:hypothetical protein
MTERTRWIGLVVFIVVCLGAGGQPIIKRTGEKVPYPGPVANAGKDR